MTLKLKQKHPSCLMLIIGVFFCSMIHHVNSEALQLDNSNVGEVLANHEFVMINFYADWCRFSNMLAPTWDELAAKVKAEVPDPGKVAIAKIDCDKETNLGTQYHISKYPTIKYIRNGVPAKREYRGQRSVEAFISFIQKETKDPVLQIKELTELANLDEKKRHILGYFDSFKSNEYETFRKIASNLKDDCDFYAGEGDAVKQMHPPGQSIVAFRPNKARSTEKDETFTGNIFNYDELNVWIQDKCTPLVREITFENAEELTEEGLPFLILFHDPADDASVKAFTEVVKSELMEDKQNVNFLIADGDKFAHPLKHLGKSKQDLPLIAIDSFRHMYLFDKYENIKVPGKLKQFLKDLYSGKLHREFHYGPDKEETSSEDNSTEESDKQAKGQDGERGNRVPRQAEARTKDPPPSQFQHLGPSKNRYTLLHDEF